MKSRILALLLAGAFAVSCASQAKGPAKPMPEGQPAKAGKLPAENAKDVHKPSREGAGVKAGSSKSKSGKVSIDQKVSSLGDIVRAAGEQTGGGIVLMNGIENRVVQDFRIRRKSLGDCVAVIAAKGHLAIEENPHYFFLYPPGYEQLLDMTLAGRLDARYADLKTDAAFGSGLPLYSVFMWMGYALNVSIVADNSIGDAECGELALTQAPLENVLEAVLKSARVSVAKVDSTPDFIFLATPANTNAASSLLDAGPLNDKQNALLNSRVTVALPRPLRTGQRLELPLHASRLDQVLASLSEQLHVSVVAEKGLEKFPVNPFFLNNVTVKTAMDLLIRQWLEPNYGYQVLADRIVIRTR